MSFQLRTRFAPTPSGWLHLGNAFSFVLTWLIARASNGHILLRIDDLDATRMRTEYVEDVFETLHWFGLDWDEGPEGPESFFKLWSQRLRVERYRQVAGLLMERHFLFPCSCSRSQVAQSSIDGQYPGTCRDKAQDGSSGASVWRLFTPSPCLQLLNDPWQGTQEIDIYSALRDVVIIKRDGVPAYQLASLVDDVDFEMTLLVRGLDLIPSSAVQHRLAGLLGWESYSRVVTLHHPLLLDHGQQKLSKSADSLSVRVLRESGTKPRRLLHWMATRLLLTQPEYIEDLESLLSGFKAEGGAEGLFRRIRLHTPRIDWSLESVQ